MRRVGLLVIGSMVFWLLVALPSRHVWGDSAAVYSGVAVLLCLVPTAATMLWANWAFRKSPGDQVLMVLGGTGLRMFVVLSGGLALYTLIPYFQEHQGFWLWILVSYLFTLVLEMALVLKGQSQAGDQYLAKQDNG
jgi:hypothetical protein